MIASVFMYGRDNGPGRDEPHNRIDLPGMIGIYAETDGAARMRGLAGVAPSGASLR